jgi:hypothetical protein
MTDPGKFGTPPQPGDISPESDEEFKLNHMLNDEGICYDYYNQIMGIELCCKMLLDERVLPNKIVEETTQDLVEGLSKLRSYSDYMDLISNKKPEPLLKRQRKFLTEKGQKIWKRLDEIIAELKSIDLSNLDRATLERIRQLLQEAHILSN